MYCPACGKQIPDNSTFCLHCGTKISAPSAKVAQAPIQWEYSEFVWTPPPNSQAIAGDDRLSEARELWWSEARPFVLEGLRKWQVEGWEPVGAVGSDCIQVEEIQVMSSRYWNGAAWLMWLFSLVPTFGLSVFALFLKRTVYKPVKIRVQMRAPIGTKAPVSATMPTKGSKKTVTSPKSAVPIVASEIGDTLNQEKKTNGDNKYYVLGLILSIALLIGVVLWSTQSHASSPPILPDRLPEPIVTLEPSIESYIPEIVPSGTPLEMLPTATEETPLIDVSGLWYLEMNYRGYTDSSGVFTNHPAKEAWNISLNQYGTSISGRLLDVVSDYGNSCVEAIIDGSFENGYLYITVQFTGSCCPGELVEIAGTVSSDGYSFNGTYQPARIPTTNCTLSTGEVTGSKR